MELSELAITTSKVEVPLIGGLLAEVSELAICKVGIVLVGTSEIDICEVEIEAFADPLFGETRAIEVLKIGIDAIEAEAANQRFSDI